MDHEAFKLHHLERLLFDENAEPADLPLSLLEAITKNFSNDQEIGRGGYAVVYQGLLRNGTVAVKKLLDYVDFDDQKFIREIDCLMRVKHKNIIRFLGYCSDTQGKLFSFNGKIVMADCRQRFLCFDYASGGSLENYITDVSTGLEWQKRYSIIRGICEGLHYLHRMHIVHLDLKPSNILLDNNMVPKISDFGYSRSFNENQTRAITTTLVGSIGYLAPEFFNGEITFKIDIYALGVIITEILTGKKGYASVVDVLECWRNRSMKSGEDIPLEQIRVCAEIGTCCLDSDPKKRPDIRHVIETLDETESIMSDRQCITEMHNDTESMDKSIELGTMSTLLRIEKTSKGLQQDDTSMMSGVESNQIMELNILERIVAGSEEPGPLDLPLLQRVTENFSEERKIGVGRRGDVYKGILRNGIVAVKRLFKSRAIENKMFHREVKSLIMVRHQNIARFLGYCSFTEEHMVSIEGGTIVVDIQEKLLCFEYMSNGSLDSHLTDELRGLEWHTRYEIIVGMCKGLLHLHKEKGVIHMDLKPANILLDDHMVPKITDFGLSRLDNNSRAKTTSLLISLGYSAPEYVLEGKSSSKSDIYSLGVIIIEVVTGSKQRMPNITKSLRRWRYRWNKSAKHTPLGYQQVSKCLELAEKCTQVDPKDRPDISNIIDELNLIDSMEDQFQVIPCSEGMLGIDPLEIHISFEHDQQIWKSIELTNDTDDCLAFVTKASLQCLHIEPDKSIVPPRSKCNVTITMMQEQVMALTNNHYTEEITVLSTRVNGGLTAGDITEHMFSDRDGNVVDEVNVIVAFGTPPLGEEF